MNKLGEYLLSKNISRYRLAQLSGVPYTTLNDICNEKTSLDKCSAETVYRIAKALNISMETLLEPYINDRCSFELFKSNVCHKLKNLGDIGFLIDTYEKDEIRVYYERQWYPESFYMLAMVDYLSRINDVELCSEYDGLREKKLSDVVYPSGVIALDALYDDDHVKEEAVKNSIPEFIRFNIVEGEVRDVI